MNSNPRYTIHGVTVQKLPPTTPNPKKRLSHTIKANPSGASYGAYRPILARLGFRGRR